MSETKELRKIKKMYGEKFMHLCRSLFPTILEQEGLLTEILTSTFATNSNTLYEDIMEVGVGDFKDFIYRKIDVEKDKPEIIDKKTPYELLEEVGYTLYECTTEEEIQKFKKYYRRDEELCTFLGGRLKSCEVFWAVKKNAEEIKREDFIKPQREDEYGTSVMGIQFDKKGKCTVSIKNRYNHTVNNPDATYGNDLDRIVPGLAQSFRELLAERGLAFDDSNIVEFELPGYTVASDGKIYKYNYEINGKYYCPGNIIIDNGNVIKLEPEKKILMDYFILDKENKTIELYDESIKDSFIDDFENIETIEVKKSEEEKGARVLTIKIKNCDKPIIIELNENNNIIEYQNEEIEKIGDNFLVSNETLRKIEIPNVQEIGNYFLHRDIALRKVNFPNVQKIGNYFIDVNKIISQVDLPNVQEIGNYFLHRDIALRKVNFPNVQKIGNAFIEFNKIISQVDLPNVQEIGDNFLYKNIDLRQVNFPNVWKIGDGFVGLNEIISQVEMPKVRELGHGFLFCNLDLRRLTLPHLEKFGVSFLEANIDLDYLVIPKLQKMIGFTNSHSNSLADALLEIRYMGKLRGKVKPEDVNYKFLYNNKWFKKMGFQNAEEIINFFSKNKGQISTKDIAQLEKQADLTTTEVEQASTIIEKIAQIKDEKDVEKNSGEI